MGVIDPPRTAGKAVQKAGKETAREPAGAAPEASKRERVLQAAERLFAEGGFDGVSMRDIAAAASVGLPLIVYHFETKRNLYRAVFERRKDVLDARLEALRRPAVAGVDVLEHIVQAFVEPMVRVQSDEDGVAYAKLIAREASDPKEAERGIVRDYFDPFAREFIEAIRLAAPGKEPEYAYWAYTFAVGALVMSVFDSRIARISDGTCRPGDVVRKTRYLVAFITAGIRGGPDLPPRPHA